MVASNIHKRLKQLEEQLKQNKVLEVGFMSEATYPDGTSVAEVAYKNEFGETLHNVPPRPFFRQTIAAKKKDWSHNVGVGLSKGLSIKDTLSLVGESAVGDIQETIKEFSDPPNARYTIEKKGFNDPLIDTGHMWKSVTSRVIDESASDS